MESTPAEAGSVLELADRGEYSAAIAKFKAIPESERTPKTSWALAPQW